MRGKWFAALAVLTALSAVAEFAARADVKLPSLISDGMVLQQQTPVRIWGWADDGEQVSVNIKAKLGGMKYSLLGLALGPMLEGGIPYFENLPGSDDDLKWFGASLASVSDVTLFHIRKRTPEWRSARKGRPKRVTITDKDLRGAQKRLNNGEEADAIGIGSPQLSPEELREIAKLLSRRRPKIPVWIFASRDAKARAKEAVESIEKAGGVVWADTCLEVSPLYYRFKTVATPSGKGAFYLPSLCRQRVVFQDLVKLLRRYS